MLKKSNLILTTENGKLQIYNNGELIDIIKIDDSIMGIILQNNIIYVNSPSRLYKITKDGKVLKQSKTFNAQFHHMNKYDNKIYCTATETNEIYIFNDDLVLEKKILIKPPKANQKVKYKINYNHINTIIKNNDKFYVNLNWFSDTQYGDSGVVEFNKNWDEIKRYKLGWESHDLQFYNDKMIVICATSNWHTKKINHLKKSGIMIDGKLVFEHDSTESFCKALTWDENYFYLCGGAKAERNDRANSLGIIYVIDKQTYKLVEKIKDKRIANIKGCRIYK